MERGGGKGLIGGAGVSIAVRVRRSSLGVIGLLH